MSAFFAVIALAAAASKAAPPPAPAKIDIIPVQGRVYLLAGGSRNVAVQIGDDGVVYVDSSTADMADQILKATRTLSQRPIRYVLNTHAHLENIGGNQALSRQGISFGGGNTKDQQFALDPRARERAQRAERADRSEGGGAERLLADRHVLHRVDGAAFQRRADRADQRAAAHTDGDSLILFRGSDVIVAGDVFLTTGYPIIDVEHGGTINGVIAALNRIIDLAVPGDNEEDGTLIVSGQGRIGDEYDVVVYRDMVTIIRDRVQDLMKKGMTLQQIQAAKPSRDYDVLYTNGSGHATPEQFIETVYKTLQGNAAGGE
jgi:glyoxylase-like metal-dependent hydrolase (beta-lactamase superfamily II)